MAGGVSHRRWLAYQRRIISQRLGANKRQHQRILYAIFLAAALVSAAYHHQRLRAVASEMLAENEKRRQS